MLAPFPCCQGSKADTPIFQGSAYPATLAGMRSDGRGKPSQYRDPAAGVPLVSLNEHFFRLSNSANADFGEIYAGESSCAGTLHVIRSFVSFVRS